MEPTVYFSGNDMVYFNVITGVRMVYKNCHRRFNLWLESARSNKDAGVDLRNMKYRFYETHKQHFTHEK